MLFHKARQAIRTDKKCTLQRLPESKERNTIESSVVCVELETVAAARCR